MSNRRNESDGRSEPPDCRYRDRSIVHEADRPGSTTVSERSRRSTRTGTANASPDRFGRSVLCVSGVALLTVTKLLDALTTGIGLLHLPGVYEANPLVKSVFHETGVVVGLVVTSVAIIVGITLVVEICSILVSVRRLDGHLAPVIRFVGYGLPSLLFAAVSIHNVGVLLSGIEAAIPL